MREIQELHRVALNTKPTQSREAFVRRRQELELPYPGLKDNAQWKSNSYGELRPVIFRPLNVNRDVLKKDWDLARCWSSHQPYSAALNNWYSMLFEKDSVARITSAHLKKYVVPSLEKQMLIAKKLALVENGVNKARLLRERLEVQKAAETALRLESLD